MYQELEIKLQAFITSALNGGGASSLAALTLRKEPCAHLLGALGCYCNFLQAYATVVTLAFVHQQLQCYAKLKLRTCIHIYVVDGHMLIQISYDCL
jgi:hypothetical protein